MKAGIAGAGIMGQLMALQLLKNGWQVTMFDRAEDDNCSHAAAGLLAPVAELAKNDIEIYRMGMTAIQQYWPEILSVLPEKIYFKTSGSIVAAHPRDQSELQIFAKTIYSKLSGAEEIYRLDKENLRALEPELQKFSEAFYLQNEGQLDNQHLLMTLKKYLMQRGVEWHCAAVENFTETSIRTAKSRHEFDLMFDCRGLGAKDAFENLRAVRGEIIWLHAPDVNISRPVRLMHPRYGLYIVPRPNQTYLLGASEIETEDYSEISVQTMLELLSAAYYIHSGFAEARIIKTVVHCRPVLTNHQPQIVCKDNLIAINGLYRHGFLIAPALAHDVMRFIRRGFSSISHPELWKIAA